MTKATIAEHNIGPLRWANIPENLDAHSTFIVIYFIRSQDKQQLLISLIWSPCKILLLQLLCSIATTTRNTQIVVFIKRFIVVLVAQGKDISFSNN